MNDNVLTSKIECKGLSEVTVISDVWTDKVIYGDRFVLANKPIFSLIINSRFVTFFKFVVWKVKWMQ